MENASVVIIGSGPAGYTAAIYAARANRNPLLFAGLQPGGQLTQTSEVENWPGEEKGIFGTALMEKLRIQAERFGTTVLQETVTSIDVTAYPYKITSASGKEVHAQTIILATGASAKWLGVPGEERLKAKGVSACATCDGFFFKDRRVVVIGGGDSAMEEATFLTKFAKEVTIIHRSDAFKASKIMFDRAKKNEKIKFIMNTTVTEILGDDRVTGVRIKNTQTQAEEMLETDGVFLAIGHEPNTKICKEFITCDNRGYIVTEGKSTKTNMPGIFACGDVMDRTYRQAVTAAGSGCAAALDAEHFLASKENGE